MEPNTKPNMIPNTETVTTPIVPNKSKNMLIVLIVIVLITIATFIIKSKVNAPIKTDTASISIQTDQITKDIDDATTFDNEAGLQAIDKEF